MAGRIILCGVNGNAAQTGKTMNIILRITAFIIVFTMGLWLVILLRRFQMPSRVRKAEAFLKEGDVLKANEIIRLVLDKDRDYPPARMSAQRSSLPRNSMCSRFPS
jgi:hypothetical protein